MTKRNKISDFLLMLMPVVLFFSYYPIITIGANETMNLELSLPEIWLILYTLCSLPQIKKLWHFFSFRGFCLAGAVPLYFTISLIWSANRLRTFLTVGLLWLLAFAILNIIYRLKNDPQAKMRTILMRVLLGSAVAVSLFCFLQGFLDVLGVSRDYTLLCHGCVATTFGFPHPNGFAIEPQFMGNLLIAPVLLCFYLLNSSTKQLKIWNQKIIIVITVFLSVTLFFTFSRGAVYAVGVGFILQNILLYLSNDKSTKLKKIGESLLLFGFSFLISLCLQGVFSAVGPTNDTFSSGVAKAIHHLSLGVIDLRSSDIESHFNNETESSIVSEKEYEEPELQQASFSGYVKESTERRLELNDYALATWGSSSQYVLVGTGIGAAGVAMNRYFSAEIGAKEIVQNEYVSLLLEGGIIGVAIIAIVFVVVVKEILRKRKLADDALFWSVILSFMISLLFFSGLPNALQIYLLPALLFGRR